MQLPPFFQFQLCTRVLYGPGIARDIVDELQQLGMHRLMVVTERLLIELGLVSPVLEALESGETHVVGIFDEVVPNSEVECVRRGVERARHVGAEGLLAIGGGSAIDTAKGINLVFSEGGDLLDYEGAQVLDRPLKPLVAIPTTSGTGSEVTHVAVIANRSESTKISFVDSHLCPSLAVIDPELTLSLPPRITAATGIDALTHAIEAYVGIEASPFSDALALQAVDLIARALPRAVEDGNDLEARSGMAVASTMAGVAFTHSMVGVVHGMAHALGGHCGVTHGEANGMMLPYGMEYNLPEQEERFAVLARHLGAETAGMPPSDAAALSVARVRELTSALHDRTGLPLRLSQTGVSRESLPAVADLAMQDGSMIYNPREVSEEAILEMLERAY